MLYLFIYLILLALKRILSLQLCLGLGPHTENSNFHVASCLYSVHASSFLLIFERTTSLFFGCPANKQTGFGQCPCRVPLKKLGTNNSSLLSCPLALLENYQHSISSCIVSTFWCFPFDIFQQIQFDSPVVVCNKALDDWLTIDCHGMVRHRDTVSLYW